MVEQNEKFVAYFCSYKQLESIRRNYSIRFVGDYINVFNVLQFSRNFYDTPWHTRIRCIKMGLTQLTSVGWAMSRDFIGPCLRANKEDDRRWREKQQDEKDDVGRTEISLQFRRRLHRMVKREKDETPVYSILDHAVTQSWPLNRNRAFLYHTLFG